MTAERDIRVLARGNGWHVLHEKLTGSSFLECLIFYKWLGGDRHELSVMFDRQGRVRCWSHWINKRAEMDQETGLRDRLEDFLVGFH